MWGAVVILAILAVISASADVVQASPELSQHGNVPTQHVQGGKDIDAQTLTTCSVHHPEQTKENRENSRIVSGWEAREGQFPYMLWLRTVRWTGDVTACGGSIIHRSWGLTSARCTAQRIEIVIHAGSVNRNTPRVITQARDSFRPPGYEDSLQPVTQPNDISLIRFSQDLTFNNNIQPIRIQRSGDRDRDYSGVLMTTSGWGTTWTCLDLDCPTPVILNWVHLTGISNFMCLLMYNSNYLVRPTTICAGPFNVTSQSICAGDSGVPLTAVEADGVATQVGIGSFGSGFGCHVGMPGGFTRPGHYHDWIRQVTGINFDQRSAVADDVETDMEAEPVPISLPLAKEPMAM